MSYRKPSLKAQANLLRAVFAERDLPKLPVGESLELVSRLNGYPSWNVASQQERASTKGSKDSSPAPTKLKLTIWTAVHVHRHGEDIFNFTHNPTEEDVIEAIEAASSWEPEDGEYIEYRGSETFEVDVPLEMAKQAARTMSQPLIGVYEVYMPDLFQYDVPEEVPEWQWVERNASLGHRGNGVEGGVWEFMVHHEKIRERLNEVPARLLTEVKKALELDAVWLMFHQG
jgi:hypothetical protein